MRRTPEITLSIELRQGAGTWPEQIAGGLRELIGRRVLTPGDPVPSSRALARHLGLSRGSVLAAYEQLLAEGYLSAHPGGATMINPQLRQLQPQSVSTTRPVSNPPAAKLDLRPGRPWVGDVIGPAWKAAWRRASSAPADVYPPALGLEDLRREWADHLRRMRGVVPDPAQLAVTGGGREGLALILLALGGGPRLRVGVEDPGYPSLRRVPQRLGATVVPLPADDQGLITESLPTGSAAPEVLLVTPSHQYPLGGSLPVARRQALLEWAHAYRVVVIEDDYDSELRYTSQPLPALAALDDPVNGRVVMLGTLSKILTPTLAAGYLALPRWLVPAVAEVRTDLGQPLGLVPQLAMADYLRSGALRLHTQRMRQRYRSRRTQVVNALRGRAGIRVYPMDGGLHAVAETVRPEAAMVAELAELGLRVSPLSQYWSSPAKSRGIVFGFGAVTEAELATGLALIASVAGKMES